tara:strand:- start:46 stop:609 length:564 start_codon:yes stop_codon:yes gene_type:complete
MALTKVIGSGIGTVTNTFTDTNVPVGSIVQVVATAVTAGATTAASAFNSFAEIQSAYRCAITPKSADNFLLLDCQFCMNQHAGNTGFIQQVKFYDVTNSADVFVGDAAGDRNRATMATRSSTVDVNDPDSIHMRAYISAASTTARTYTPYMHCEQSGGEFDFGYSASNGSDFQWTTPYLLTITEIKG